MAVNWTDSEAQKTDKERQALKAMGTSGTVDSNKVTNRLTPKELPK